MSDRCVKCDIRADSAGLRQGLCSMCAAEYDALIKAHSASPFPKGRGPEDYVSLDDYNQLLMRAMDYKRQLKAVGAAMDNWRVSYEDAIARVNKLRAVLKKLTAASRKAIREDNDE